MQQKTYLFLSSREEARAFTEPPSVRISFEDPSNCDWLPDPVDPEKLTVLNSINKGESLSPHGLEDVPDLGFSFHFTDFHLKFLREIKAFIATHGRSPRILDVGCGYGKMVTAAYFAGVHVVGVDLIKDYAQEAVNRFKSVVGGAEVYAKLKGEKKVHFGYGDVLTLNYEEPFDFVWCYSVMHLVAPSKHNVFCGKLNSFLGEGGRLFLDCQAPISLLEIFPFDFNPFVTRIRTKEANANVSSLEFFISEPTPDGFAYRSVSSTAVVIDKVGLSYMKLPSDRYFFGSLNVVLDEYYKKYLSSFVKGSIVTKFKEEKDGTKKLGIVASLIKGLIARGESFPELVFGTVFYTPTLQDLSSLLEGASFTVLERRGTNALGRYNDTFNPENPFSYYHNCIIAQKA